MMKIWTNKSKLPAIDRSFSKYIQMLLAIMENKGDNNHLSEREGISFGIRKYFMTSRDRDGVIMVLETHKKGESIQEEIINYMCIKKLRHSSPKKTMPTTAKIDQHQHDLLLA